MFSDDEEFIDGVLYPMVFKMTCMVCKGPISEKDRENIVQQTIADFAMPEKISWLMQLHQKAQLRPFLHGVVRHKCADFFNRRKKERSLFVIGYEGLEEISNPMAEDDPSETTQIHSDLPKLNEIWGRLPRKQELVLVKLYIKGMTQRQAADSMHCSLGKVNNLKSKALKTARKLMEGPQLCTVEDNMHHCIDCAYPGDCDGKECHYKKAE